MKIIKKILQKYFKFFTYKIFKIIYGEIDGKVSHLDNREIKLEKVKIDKDFYEVFGCQNSSLYTNRVYDAAIIKNNKIVDGPSFQLRNGYYKNCLENSVLNTGTPRLKKILKGRVLSLLTGGGGNSNYWHWLLDVLPRIKIFNNSKNKKNIDYFLLPSLKADFQKETLDLLEIESNKRLSSVNYRHIYAEEIITTSHPYILLNDPYLDSLNIPIWIIDFLRSNFLKKALVKSKIKNFPERIHINRKDATALRYIVNLKKVENVLENEKFTDLTMSNYSFIDQVALFYNAKKIAGLHGAGFANIVFCKPGTKIIEMRTSTTGDIIKNFALKNKLVHYDINSEPKTIKFGNQEGDIEIDLVNLKKTLCL